MHNNHRLHIRRDILCPSTGGMRSLSVDAVLVRRVRATNVVRVDELSKDRALNYHDRRAGPTHELLGLLVREVVMMGDAVHSSCGGSDPGKRETAMTVDDPGLIPRPRWRSSSCGGQARCLYRMNPATCRFIRESRSMTTCNPPYPK